MDSPASLLYRTLIGLKKKKKRIELTQVRSIYAFCLLMVKNTGIGGSSDSDVLIQELPSLRGRYQCIPPPMHI